MTKTPRLIGLPVGIGVFGADGQCIAKFRERKYAERLAASLRRQGERVTVSEAWL